MSSDPSPNENRVTDSLGRPISPSVANELQTAVSRIGGPVTAQRVSDRLFTEEDRQRLGGDLEACWRRLGSNKRMWMEARNVTVERAIIDIAEGLNLLDVGTARWLRRELQLEDDPAVPPTVSHPSWNAERGELRLENRVIRRVRVMRTASNIQRIVDAFEAAGWPNRVDNPLSLGQQQLHQTLLHLNSGLDEIRFRAQEGGNAVVWERV